MKRTQILLVACLIFTASTANSNPLPVVTERVDLERYSGLWYEISKYPNRFQRKCDRSTADYKLVGNRVKVTNVCFDTDGKVVDTIIGQAKVVDTETNAKLKVSFLPKWLRWTGIGAGDYWIIELGNNYDYVVVSEPKRKYLWILSRTPQMNDDLYQGILERLTKNGFDIQELKKNNWPMTII